MARLKWHYEDVYPKCAELSSLLGTHGAPVLAIVGSGVCDIVHGGSARLQELSRKQTESHTVKASKSQAQRQFFDFAGNYLGVRRKCIETEFIDDPATCQEFGLHIKIAQRTPKAVTSAIEVFVNCAEKNPEKVARANIPVDNIAKLKETLKTLVSGEIFQEGTKSSAKISTSERNAAQLDVETAMIKVVNASVIAYEGKPEIIALFKAALPKRRNRSRKSIGTEPAVTEPVKAPTTVPEPK